MMPGWDLALPRDGIRVEVSQDEGPEHEKPALSGRVVAQLNAEAAVLLQDSTSPHAVILAVRSVPTTYRVGIHTP
jgi:hypothetical protein